MLMVTSRGNGTHDADPALTIEYTLAIDHALTTRMCVAVHGIRWPQIPDSSLGSCHGCSGTPLSLIAHSTQHTAAMHADGGGAAHALEYRDPENGCENSRIRAAAFHGPRLESGFLKPAGQHLK
jgi:hypothetical protein